MAVKKSSVVGRCLKIVVLVITLVVMLSPSVALVTDISIEGSKNNLWGFITGTEMETSLGTAPLLEEQNVLDLGKSLLELSDEMQKLDKIVLKVSGIAMYVIFFATVLSLIANVISLFFREFGGKSSNLLSKLCSFQLGGLLSVWAFLILTTFLGFSSMTSMAGMFEENIIFRFVFTGINYVYVWAGLLVVRIVAFFMIDNDD